MGAGKELVLIDTNVFVIDLRYIRDKNYKKNKEFLKTIAQNGAGFTTIVNVLEVCGILSFNLNEKQTEELWYYFQQHYRVAVHPQIELDADFPAFSIRDLFDLIKRKTSFGDALMLMFASKYLSFISTIVTWDKDHLKDKYPGTVITPYEYLKLYK